VGISIGRRTVQATGGVVEARYVESGDVVEVAGVLELVERIDTRGGAVRLIFARGGSVGYEPGELLFVCQWWAVDNRHARQ
jgi:hypothetical protein